MTLSLKHTFTSAKSDGSDATLVQPSNWNAEHTILMATAKILGRATAGTGAVEELSVTGSGNVVLADSPTFTTQMVGPLLIGGTGTGSTLTLESTSGAGATDAIIFKTGAQVEHMRIGTDGEVTLTSADPGASGQVLSLYQNSASPAVNDKTGFIRFYGNDSGANKTLFGEIYVQLLQTTNGTEYGCLVGNVMSAGAMTDVTLATQTFMFGYQNPASTNFEYVFRGPSGKVTYMYLESFDPGATGPSYTCWHNSASPAASDVPGAFLVDGQDSAGNYQNYSKIETVITSPTSTSESADIRFSTVNAGTLAERMRISGKLITIGGFAPSALGSLFEISVDPTVDVAGNILTYGNSVSGAGLFFQKTRNASPLSHTVVQSGDSIGGVLFQGSDGAAYRYTAAIQSEVDATPGSSDMPGRLLFKTTLDGTASPTERMRIDNAGAIFLIGVSTTASAANAFINNASSPVNSILRSTSSLRYKKDVEPVDAKYRDAVLAINPIWYRSKSEADNADHSFYGMAAEEVAAIDPRLCHWTYLDEDYDVVVKETDDPDLPQVERVLKPGAKLVPDAVMYDRVAILQIAALAAKVTALEARLAGPRN